MTSPRLIDRRTPSWEKALDDYREELAGNDDYESILETGTLEELISHTKTLKPSSPPGKPPLNAMNRMKPVLKFANDFSNIVSVCFGEDAKLAAVVWGSIRLILTLASSAAETLRDVLDMLEDLSLALPRFGAYEEILPMNSSLEASLLDVYTEAICFYARAIYFLRNRPHLLLRQHSWKEFQGDFNRTIQRIKRLSSTAEREAGFARMRMGKGKYDEILKLITNFKEKVPDATEALSMPRHYLPFAVHLRFWGRQEILEQVDMALNSKLNKSSLRSFALYGMAGVGKTQVALKYASSVRDRFDTVLWVAAVDTTTIGKSFWEIAKHLGLMETDQGVDDNAAIIKVKSWLLDTRNSWLLIFDNANDLDVLKHVWPQNTVGSILLTTRDFHGALHPAMDGYKIEPFDSATGSTALLNILNLDIDSESNIENAQAIVSTLGGLPLAIGQIGGFLSERKIPLREFLPLYERNAFEIDLKRTGLSDHEQVLGTIWEETLTRLSGNSRLLMMLLAFFHPGKIPRSILSEGSRLAPNSDFSFLNDEIGFLDAEGGLLHAALIDKSSEGDLIHLHRLIQRAVARRLSPKERSKMFDVAVDILSWGFPDTHSVDVGHQISGWARCESCLPHLDHLLKQAKTYDVTPTDSQRFAELLLRCCWYLYEREHYAKAKAYIQMALKNFTDQSCLAYASAVDLSGLIELDLSNPHTALDIFKKVLGIRQKILEQDDAIIATSLVNLGLAYTEMGELEQAHESLQQSIDIRLKTNSDRIGNSYSNMSSLLLRMAKPNDAEEMLKCCPSLKDFTDETFMKTGNPRFSGDMVLLSRIRLAQGRLDEAQHLATKALAFRQNILGYRLKICDSLYQVADLLLRQENIASATKLISECVAISENLPECEGQRHLAQAKYKLSILLDPAQKETESKEYRKQALDLKSKILGADATETGAEITELESFERLTPWMLW